MRFLVDECTGPKVAKWLHGKGHEVFSVYDEARGLNDDDIIEKACAENWILITNDKDFGEKVYRAQHSHRGIIFILKREVRIQEPGARIFSINHLYQNIRSTTIHPQGETNQTFRPNGSYWWSGFWILMSGS